MKQLNNFINEKLRISSKNYKQYNYYPKTNKELREILEERLRKDKNADLNDIDVSEITDMHYISKYGVHGLFYELYPHNIDISQWDVSKVKDMSFMFYDCENFNCNLSKWDVSKVEDMRYMFWGCTKFNCDLSDWNVSKVTDMRYMFDECPIENNSPSWYKL